jgi:hypothetical protein
MNIQERFSWFTPEMYKLIDVKSPKKVVFKGRALKGETVSKNRRSYTAEELKRGARTFSGVPLTINHAPINEEDARIKKMPFDQSKIIGHVSFMEYDDDDNMEYVAESNKEPYIDMIKNRDPRIRNVSIEADYMYLVCTVQNCGKKFGSEEEWQKHMIGDHFIKDGIQEVHGMRGKALSLVIFPAEAGVPNTTVDLMETYEKPVLRLLETIAMDKEDLRMSKDIDGLPMLDKTGRILMVDKHGRIVENVEESKAAVGVGKEVMVLGEPFAGYTDMDDCKAKNADKADPAAYCATIMRQVEEIKTMDSDALLKKLRTSFTESEHLLLDAFVDKANQTVHSYQDAEIKADVRQHSLEVKLATAEQIITETYSIIQNQKRVTETDHKTVDERVKLAEQKVQETYKVELAESAKLAEKCEKLQIENDNLRDKIKGQFKGHSPSIVQASKEEPENPLLTSTRR